LTPVKSAVGTEYNLVSSSWEDPAKLPAALTIPAHVGDETLVPPTINHAGLPASVLLKTHTPVAGLASEEMSGVPR
jgi:hypothetical protein